MASCRQRTSPLSALTGRPQHLHKCHTDPARMRTTPDKPVGLKLRLEGLIRSATSPPCVFGLPHNPAIGGPSDSPNGEVRSCHTRLEPRQPRRHNLLRAGPAVAAAGPAVPPAGVIRDSRWTPRRGPPTLTVPLFAAVVPLLLLCGMARQAPYPHSVTSSAKMTAQCGRCLPPRAFPGQLPARRIVDTWQG